VGAPVEIPFVGGAYKGFSTDHDAQECINWYVDIDPKSDKPMALYPTPGTVLLATVGTGPIRGMHAYNGALIVVSGFEVYSVTTAGASTLLGSLWSNTGPVSIADNGTANGEQVMIVDGTLDNGWIYDSGAGTFTKIADTDFPGGKTVVFHNSRFIVNKPDTGEFYISSSYDGTAWDATEFATAEGSPDNIEAVVAFNENVYLAGSMSFESWFDAAAPDFPYQRFEGGFDEIGCAAAFSPARLSGGIAYLAQSKEGGFDVRLLGASQAPAISSPSMEQEIATYPKVSDATGFTYKFRGHEFYVLTFPSADVTWVFDAKSREWHKWSSVIDGTHPHRHLSSCHAFVGMTNYVGDYRNGNIYSLSQTTYTDNGTTIIRDRVARCIRKPGLGLIVYHKLVADMETGVGLTAGQGVNPKALLRFSDGGKDWSSWIEAPLGRMGLNLVQAIWTRLGAAQKRYFWLRVTDPVKAVVLGASLEVS
jgi:hypothetical protein